MKETPPSGADPPRPDASIALSTGDDSPPTQSVYRIPPDFLPPGRATALPAIEGYEILRELHRGGQGVVYEALQKSTHRKVAIKTLLDEQYASESAKKRFDREVKLVAQLRHPSIITVHDSGTTPDGRCYLIMDYVSGISLREFVLHHRLSLERTLGLFAEVCSAIEHAHQHGVIHRDLKPSNILVDDDGRPVVLDFGLAKSTTVTSETLVSQTGHLIGTWPYMSPEQTRGRPEDIDARSDVYALGVVLYELLTGHYPYPITGSVEEVLRSIRESPPVLPSRRWDSSVGIAWYGEDSGAAPRCPLDKDLDTILLKALAKEAGRRYASAGDLARDLEHYLRGEPIEARRDSISYVLRKRGRALARRHRVTTLAVVVMLSAAVARFVGVPFFYSWTSINNRFESAVMSSFSPAPIAGPFERVRVIGIGDATDFEALARQEGIEGVSNAVDQKTSWRRVHGRLMQKLAGSGCRTIVWDIVFPNETSFDGEFGRGVRALRDAGVEVVTAVPSFWLEDPGRPQISPTIAEGTRLGCALTSLSKEKPWLLFFVAQRGLMDALPSLALAALAAYQRPGAEVNLVLEKDLFDQSLNVLYWKPGAIDRWAPRYFGAPAKIPLTALRPLEAGDPLLRPDAGLQPYGSGLREGDWVGSYQMAVPPDTVLSASTLAYEQVMAATAKERIGWLAGKLVIIGYTGPTREQWFAHPDGRRLPGCYAHASALDALVRGVSLRLPRILGENLFPVLGALAGCMTVLALGAGLCQKYLALGAWAVLLVLAAAAAFRQFHYFFDPLVPFFALWVGCEMGTLCRRICNSRIDPGRSSS